MNDDEAIEEALIEAARVDPVAARFDEYMADHGGWSFESISTRTVYGSSAEDEVLVLEDNTCSRTSLHRFVKQLRSQLHQLGFTQADCDGPVDRWFEPVE